MTPDPTLRRAQQLARYIRIERERLEAWHHRNQQALEAWRREDARVRR